MTSRKGTLCRLSKHLRFGGRSDKWYDSHLVGEEVSLVHYESRKVLAAGRLEGKGGFSINNKPVYLRGIVEVSPQERKILYNPDYLNPKQEEGHLYFGMTRETSALGGFF